MQHVGPTSSNIVVSNMLGPFEHHVGYCCIMLDDVGSSLILFKLFIQHRPTFDEKLVQRHRCHGDLHLQSNRMLCSPEYCNIPVNLAMFIG